jgi:hypothetical protein
MTKKRAEKIRFIFGKDMTPEEMVDAVVRMAKEYDIPFKDNRKEHGIPIVDSRRKDRAKRKKIGKKAKKSKLWRKRLKIGEQAMWIFSSQGFLSIVKHTDKPNILVVRSRFRGHIEKIFPNAHVDEDANRDYRFRVELPVEVVSKTISRMVSQIDYPNFKNSLGLDDEKYLESCVQVYETLANNSGDWDLDNLFNGRRGTDESKQAKGWAT